MSIVNQNFKPVTDPNINSVFADMLPIVRANPQYLNAYLLTGSPTEKLAAAMIKDMPQTKQAPPAQAPAQSVIDRMAGESAGVAALQQPQMPMQVAQPEMQPEMQMAQGGLAMLPLPDTMFNEEAYAGGGIIAFEDGGDVPRYASQGAVRRPAFLGNPVGKYFNPADLEKYDDSEIQELLNQNPALSKDDIFKQQQLDRERYGIKNIYDEQRKALEADTAENEKFKSTIESDALLNAAAGFLGNTSQFFGPGAEAGVKGYTTTKREGQKEYRANAKDIRNLGFDIGRADQAMRQAEMTGDQAMFNSERARREGLVKEARDIKFKNVADKNALLNEGAKSSAAYDTTMGAAYAKAKAAGKTAGLDVNKLNAQILDRADKMMANQFPGGSFETQFKNNPEEYQRILSGYIKQAEDYVYNSIIADTPPGAKPAEKDKPVKAADPSNLANPSKLTKATIAGKKVDPRLKSLLSKYPDSSGSTEDEDE